MIELPDLPYGYDALEPTISRATMHLHHDKHHAKYVDTVNALAGEQQLGEMSLEDLIQQAAMSPDRKLFNNAAQAWNHAFFWACMAPAQSPPSAALAAAIRAAFGDGAGLRKRFIEVGAAHFGSGWVWLAAEDSRLSVFSTHDAETVVTRDLTPLLVCDVWEHAYYLDHQNDRVAYLGAWWDRVANWAFADAQFAAENGGPPAWRHPAKVVADGPPIADHTAYELALQEAVEFMEHPLKPDSPDGRRFGKLLDAIARYQSQMAAAPAAVAKEAGAPLRELEKRISQATRIWVRDHRAQEGHWSPMIGGDWGQGDGSSRR
jgi:Fe-Mn family superoxide dismutase